MVPGMAKTPTHTSDVAIAVLSGSPTSSVKAGTITIPPPMPSRPERPAGHRTHDGECKR